VVPSDKLHSKNQLFIKRRPTYLRRAPFLISYWQGDALYFENYLTRKKIQASARVTLLLHFFHTWQPESKLLREWSEFTPDSLRNAVKSLVAGSFLQRASSRRPKPAPSEKALQNWNNWDPAASFFHFSTKDSYQGKITREEIRGFELQAGAQGIPQPIKKYPGRPVIDLPASSCEGAFPRVLRERRTWRKFGRKPITLTNLSELLYLAFGVQTWVHIPKIGRFAQKTSPSGGALYPLEAYVFSQNVSGLSNGIYHYAADRHKLVRLRHRLQKSEVQKYLADQWWFRDAAFVVFLTAIFQRTSWKYDYPRAYRAVLAEAGHTCQTFCLTATWQGLAPFCTMALADTLIEKTLGVDGIGESVLYAMGAGTKPEGK